MKIRKILLVVGCFLSSVIVQGCSIVDQGKHDFEDEKIVSFGTKEISSKEGTNVDDYDIIDQSMYLDTELLNKDSSTMSSYQIYEVTRGDFITSYDLIKGELYYPDVREVTCEYEKGTMIFEEYLVEQGQYVKVGDPIAKVHIELDTTELHELNLRLDRYQQRYEEDKTEFESREKEYSKRLQEKMTEAQSLQLQLEYEDYLNQWESTEEKWITTIEDTQEAIAVYEETQAMTELVSDVEGYLIQLANLYEGVEIKNDDVICSVVPNGAVYVKVENKNQLLSYGCPVTVKFGAKQITYDGQVVSVDSKTTSYDLYDEFAYILVNCNLEAVYSFRSATISYVAQSMKDVLLVDRTVVTVEDDIPYVTVLNEDGSFLKTGFIAGGVNQNYYWVYTGLSEGMKLVK